MNRGRRRWARVARIVIPGKPPVKKNRQQIAKRRDTGRSFILPNEDYLAWVNGAIWHITAAWRRCGHSAPIGGEFEHVQLQMRFFLPGSSQPDLSNLYEAVQDALQSAGVLTNDYWVVGHDGSDRQYAADDREARVEVTVFACVL